MIRVVLFDQSEDSASSKKKDREIEIGQCIVPLPELKMGFRHLSLVDEHLLPVVDGRVHIYSQKERFEDDDESVPRRRSESPTVLQNLLEPLNCHFTHLLNDPMR